jgi:hypothetical protein
MNLMNLIKVMNFSGAGETINFSLKFTLIRRGLQCPQPAAVHHMVLGRIDLLSLRAAKRAFSWMPLRVIDWPRALG